MSGAVHVSVVNCYVLLSSRGTITPLTTCLGMSGASATVRLNI